MAASGRSLVDLVNGRLWLLLFHSRLRVLPGASGVFFVLLRLDLDSERPHLSDEIVEFRNHDERKHDPTHRQHQNPNRDDPRHKPAESKIIILREKHHRALEFAGPEFALHQRIEFFRRDRQSAAFARNNNVYASLLLAVR